VNASEILTKAVAIPAGIAVVAGLLAWMLKRGAPRAEGPLVGLGLAAAFATAAALLDGVPSFPLLPSEDATRWVFWFAAAGAVLGVAEELLPPHEGLRLPLRWAAGTAAGWVMLRPRVMVETLTTTDAVVRAAGAGVVVAALWTAIESRSKKGGWVALALPPVIAAAAAGWTFFDFASSLSLARLAGALAAAVAATAVVARGRGSPALPVAAAPVVALVFVGLLLGAYGYVNYGDVVKFPLGTGLLLAAAACAVVVPRAWAAAGAAFVLATVAAWLASPLGPGRS
jgi:hypothetical protein